MRQYIGWTRRRCLIDGWVSPGFCVFRLGLAPCFQYWIKALSRHSNGAIACRQVIRCALPFGAALRALLRCATFLQRFDSWHQAQKRAIPSGWSFLVLLFGGAGGNRTRVRQQSICRSTCLARPIDVSLYGSVGRSRRVRDTVIGAALFVLRQLISCFWGGGAGYSENETYKLPSVL